MFLSVILEIRLAINYCAFYYYFKGLRGIGLREGTVIFLIFY